MKLLKIPAVVVTDEEREIYSIELGFTKEQVIRSMVRDEFDPDIPEEERMSAEDIESIYTFEEIDVIINPDIVNNKIRIYRMANDAWSKLYKETYEEKTNTNS